MKRLAIIGSGDLGQLIAYHAITDKQFLIAGFFDDFRKGDDVIDGHKILGGTSTIEESFAKGNFDSLIVAIGYKHFEQRKRLFNLFFDKKIPMASFVHSSSFKDPSCVVGDGTVVLPECVLDRNVVLGMNILVNTGTCIAHDSRVLNHSFLSPRVAIAGFSTVGECCNIGINTTIIDNVSICDNVQTGGGTVVIKNIETPGLYVGNPAKFIR